MTGTIWIEGVGFTNAEKSGVLEYLPKNGGEISFQESWPRFFMKMHYFAKGDIYYLQINPQSGKIRVIVTFASEFYENHFRNNFEDNIKHFKSQTEYTGLIKMLESGDFYKLYEGQTEIKNIRDRLDIMLSAYGVPTKSQH